MSDFTGFVLAVPEDRREDYVAHATRAWPMFKRHGALRMVEGWGEDVPRGTRTDFYRATEAQPGEVPVMSWIEWPDRAAADAAWAALTAEEPEAGEMPFDGMRMFWGGFTPVVDLR